MENLQEEKKFWLAIGKNPKIGPASFSQILSKKVPLSKIYKASEGELENLGLSKKIISEIVHCQKNIDPDKVIEELRKREIKTVTLGEKEYPKSLREIYNPPILYYRGKLDDSLKLAVIGNRHPTNYGVEATMSITTRLAKSGVTIVSGMAIGIDTVAHKAALEAGGKTIAVLGCGLDQIYPSRNVQLAKEIIENGAIITELPIGVPPMRYNFPIRNRIISGLSEGIVVTEAAARSGSLITASIGLEQNKDIYAIPGPIFNINSQGPNNLIKMGAKIVTRAEDILEEIGLESEHTEKKLPTPDSTEEGIIINILKQEPKHIDSTIKSDFIN